MSDVAIVGEDDGRAGSVAVPDPPRIIEGPPAGTPAVAASPTRAPVPPPVAVPRLTSGELAASLVAFVAWMVLVTAGISIGTQDFIDAIRRNEMSTTEGFIACVAVIAACHTVTNTAMLCCIAAFLGGLGFRALGPAPGSETPVDRRAVYVAAVTRGFFIFLIIQSGSVILSDQAFTNLSLEKYIRLAGLSSLLSFTVGYNPDVFRQLMDRVNQNFAAGSTR